MRESTALIIRLAVITPVFMCMYTTQAAASSYRDALYHCTKLPLGKKEKCLDKIARKAAKEYLKENPGKSSSGKKSGKLKNDFVSGTKKFGHWSVEKSQSKLTDSKDVYATLKSSNKVHCSWSPAGQRVHLILRCRENTTSLFFSTGCHMTSSQYSTYGQINFRLDKLAPRKMSTNASSNNRALGLWRGRTSIPFAKSLRGKKNLFVRMTPFGESAIEAEFKLAGVNEVLREVGRACKW